jgi:quinol monooxygenase YgiN
MIHILARIVARPDGAAAVEAALAELASHTRNEAGCISYEVFRRTEAQGEFMTVEQWRDVAATDAHMATPHVAAALAKVGALLAAAPEIHRYEPV